MYYGYNDAQEIVFADEAFIALLKFNSFNALQTSDVMSKIKFKEKQFSITQEEQTINAHSSRHEIFSKDGLFYLIELDEIQVESNIATHTPKGLITSYPAIYLDVEKISKEIGLSVADYKLYLDSFIDQSIIDEKRLLEGNDKVVKNLSNLALTLKIPQINILLLKIQKLSQYERMPLVDEYYTKLVLLTLEKPEGYEEEISEDMFESDLHTPKKEEELNARFSDLLKNVDNDKSNNDNDIIADDPLFSDELPIIDSNHLSLDNVPLLPISYDPQTAADELNLPVVLIEEFVDDFIEQARQDKDHLLTSYHQKDLDNIHELGHKLKGAASNLRINELSDILEEIQFCSDYTKLESLFVEYWGHFLSLEKQMKQLKD